MKLTWIPIIAVTCALGVQTLAQTPNSVTAKLTYKLFKNHDEANKVVWSGGRYINLLDKKNKEWQIPGATGKVVFFDLGIGPKNGSTVAALGYQNPKSARQQYTRLWIDWNGNGKFEPTESYTAAKGNPNEETLFGPIAFPTGEGAKVVKFWLEASPYNYAILRPAGIYSGVAQIDGRSVLVGVIDSNFDRIHSGNSRIRYGNNLIAADINGDGDFTLHKTDTLATFPAQSWPEGSVLPFPNNEYWSTSITSSGDLTLTRNTAPQGTLKIGDGPVTATLFANGSYYLSSRTGEIKLPADSYSLADAQLSLRAKDNALYKVTISLNNQKDAKPLVIRGGETTEIKCEAPFDSEIVMADRQKNQPYTFNIATKDSAGHAVSSIYGPTGERPPAPELTIRQNGKVIKTATFAYG